MKKTSLLVGLLSVMALSVSPSLAQVSITQCKTTILDPTAGPWTWDTGHPVIVLKRSKHTFQFTAPIGCYKISGCYSQGVPVSNAYVPNSNKTFYLDEDAVIESSDPFFEEHEISTYVTHYSVEATFTWGASTDLNVYEYDWTLLDSHYADIQLNNYFVCKY